MSGLLKKCGTRRTLNWVAPRELKPCEIRSRWRRKIQSLSTTLLTKDFNIPRNSSQTWIALSDFRNTSKVDLEALKPRYGIGGIDLSKTTDLTCATVLFKIPNDVKILR